MSIVQSQMVGYDGVKAALPSGMTYCNAGGVHEPATGELRWGDQRARLSELIGASSWAFADDMLAVTLGHSHVVLVVGRTQEAA